LTRSGPGARCAFSRAIARGHREGIADGEQKRDFIFVEDVVKVLHFALGSEALFGKGSAQGIQRGIYNLGTGQARTFYDLARGVYTALKLEHRIEFIPMPEELRARYQYFTEAKMERLRAAGFAGAFTSLEEGIRQYVQRLSAT
jgi:ADP-L-glycero-D-manno-heptose 6-epimerase